jgi:hypothetical protein
MGETEIAGFRRKSYKTLQTLARKTATFHHNINGMDVVQGEPSHGFCVSICSDLLVLGISRSQIVAFVTARFLEGSPSIIKCPPFVTKYDRSSHLQHEHRLCILPSVSKFKIL